MEYRARTLALTLLLATSAFGAVSLDGGHEKPGKKSIVPPSDADRAAMIHRAEAWLPGPLPIAKPALAAKLGFDAPVRCRFHEFDPQDPPNGRTPKFDCDFEGETLKVKYSSPSEPNPGIFGESLSTGLFRKLGFPADSIYRVKVTCENCPAEPWNEYRAEIYQASRKAQQQPLCGQGSGDPACGKILHSLNQPRGTYTFDDAEVELKYPAPAIERYAHQGWSWSEFDDAAPEVRTQREALALLAAFIQHADNKAEQQRLVCLDAPACSKTLLMIQDLGFTFGEGFNPQYDSKYDTASLAGFRHAPLWADGHHCMTDLRYYTNSGMPASKRISEEGRKFLADKLAALTDEDLNELFTLAHVERTGEGATVEGWIQSFHERVKLITQRSCP